MRAFLKILLLCTFVSILPNSAFAEERLSITFTVDISGSIRGEKFTQIKNSIKQVIDSLKPNDQYSLVTFSDKVEVIVSNTSDRDSFNASLESIKPEGSTSLYDGLSKSIQITPDLASSVIILFSDGEDNASKFSRSKLPALIDSFKGLVVLIGVGDSRNLESELREISGNKGKVISVVNLDELTNQLNSIIKPSIEAKLKTNKSNSDSVEKNVLQISSFLIFTALLLLFTCYFLLRARSDQKKKIKLLGMYDNADSKVESKNYYFRMLKFPFFAKYVAKQELKHLAAGLNVSVQNWVYLQVGVFIAVELLLQALGLTPIFSLSIAAFAGFGLSNMYLNGARNRKSAAFADELPEVLTMIASSLKSGLSFTQTISSVARESDGEVAIQFRRVLAEVQIGKNLIEALQDVADRMKSQDFQWTISALTIQREIGGNLSEILSTTAEGIRGRSEIRNEIKALSAEGRMSAYVLIAIPMFMLAYLRVSSPEAFGLMFSTGVGLTMIGIVAVLMVIGWAWVQKVVNIKL